jgi:ribosome-associated protein
VSKAKAPLALKAAKKAAPPPQPAKPKWPPLVETLLTRLDEAKAEAIVTIDLTGKSTVADTMVVASGRSNRHVDAIARQAIEELEKSGVKNIRSEGMPQCDWVLVDAGDILLHVFRPEVRSFYNLEKLWSAHAP